MAKNGQKMPNFSKKNPKLSKNRQKCPIFQKMQKSPKNTQFLKKRTIFQKNSQNFVFYRFLLEKTNQILNGKKVTVNIIEFTRKEDYQRIAVRGVRSLIKPSNICCNRLARLVITLNGAVKSRMDDDESNNIC